MKVTGRLWESLRGADRCRSLAGCEKGHAELSDAGMWQVVRKVMQSSVMQVMGRL